MKGFSQKRNATSYDSAGNVTTQELEAAIKAANELRVTIMAWLQKNHPELLNA
jgi:hypothetical protein